jgi:Ca2+-binding RTX toxin-like protein
MIHMRFIPVRKLLLLTLLLLFPVAIYGVYAAANTVPQTTADDVSVPISITDLLPAECGSLGITRIENPVTGQVRGSGINTMFLGTSGNDTITGKNGADCLVGGDGDDVLTGGQGGDVLLGGAGNDKLDGGQGTDVCYGGSGTNTFNKCESTPTP